MPLVEAEAEVDHQAVAVAVPRFGKSVMMVAQLGITSALSGHTVRPSVLPTGHVVEVAGVAPVKSCNVGGWAARECRAAHHPLPPRRWRV